MIICDELFDIEFEILGHVPEYKGDPECPPNDEEFEFKAWFVKRRGQTILFDRICEMPEELKKIYHEKFIKISKEEKNEC